MKDKDLKELKVNEHGYFPCVRCGSTDIYGLVGFRSIETLERIHSVKCNYCKNELSNFHSTLEAKNKWNKLYLDTKGLIGIVEDSMCFIKNKRKEGDNMQYTLCFIFNSDMSKVLMQKKNRGPFTGCYNGVGGKVESSDPTFHQAMFREIKEGTGLSVSDFSHSHDLVTESFFTGAELHVYYGVLHPTAIVIQKEDEELKWMDSKNLLLDVTNPQLAGDGNIPYFIHFAMKFHEKSKFIKGGLVK